MQILREISSRQHAYSVFVLKCIVNQTTDNHFTKDTVQLHSKILSLNKMITVFAKLVWYVHIDYFAIVMH